MEISIIIMSFLFLFFFFLLTTFAPNIKITKFKFWFNYGLSEKIKLNHFLFCFFSLSEFFKVKSDLRENDFWIHWLRYQARIYFRWRWSLHWWQQQNCFLCCYRFEEHCLWFPFLSSLFLTVNTMAIKRFFYHYCILVS